MSCRSVDPRYQLVVVNRLSPENRVEDVTPELQIQDQDPYLFYKNRKGETHGIWFYNGQDRERIVSFIEGYLATAPTHAPRTHAPHTTHFACTGGALHLLTPSATPNPLCLTACAAWTRRR